MSLRRSSVSGGTGIRMSFPSFSGFNPWPEERMALSISPMMPGEIDKAIRSSGQGLNPQNDGKLIRIPVPPLTEERRKDMVKQLHKILEDHRTAVRNIRRDGNEAIKKAMKDKKISEDEERKALDEIQKLTD